MIDRIRKSERLRTVWRWIDIAQYPLMLLMRWMAAWILLSMAFDIPAPAIVEQVHQYPTATLAAMAFIIFVTAGDAAKWNKQEVFGND